MPARSKLQDNLVINRYLLSLFGKESFSQLAALLRYIDEGRNEENISRFCLELTKQLNLLDGSFHDKLLELDKNIFDFTNQINARRSEPITWKYFQYLSLLFIELYLDKFFTDPEKLLEELEDTRKRLIANNEFNFDIPEFLPEELNKIALWQATGSGKTLLMHINLLSLQHHMTRNKKEHLFNKVLLITPNEGLTDQHLEEFEASGIAAQRFDDGAQLGLLTEKNAVQVIEITKLKDTAGQKTIAVESFGQNNIVFIDEGHRGASGDEWKRMRDYVSAEGFAIEYSATFGQAIKANDKKQFSEYAKSIVFDYSYKYFYGDGYGKDYSILNIKDTILEQHRYTYLVASLLTYYQQLKLYHVNKKHYLPYNIHEPLMVFVGYSVNAVRKQSGQDVSDVVDVLLFLKEFVEKSEETIVVIGNIMTGRSGLIDTSSNDIFQDSFNPIADLFNSDPSALYSDILSLLFGGSGSLLLENLTGADGEIALRLGNNNHFGLINVGDSSSLIKLCDENGLLTTSRQFTGSLFSEINQEQSPIKILIGSKKFTEGWSSWRVSTMGLLNMGRSEGSAVIQLFGRGVRLKGYEMSLKRSNRLFEDRWELKNLLPKNIVKNETLNIFGLRADYMEAFRDYLEEEGVETDEEKYTEVIIPVKNSVISHELKTIGLKDDAPIFKQTIILDTKKIASPRNLVELDLYPKLQSIQAIKKDSGNFEKKEWQLTEGHLAFLDMKTLLFEVERHKNMNSWRNLTINLESILSKLLEPDWYVIYAPNSSFCKNPHDWLERQIVTQNEVVLPLVRKLLDRWYSEERESHYAKYREYQKLVTTDKNFVAEHKVMIEKSRLDLIDKLKSIKDDVDTLDNDFTINPVSGLLIYSKHLYKPLVYINQKNDYIKVLPVALNDGEERFVREIRDFTSKHNERIGSKSIYLLRNQSKGNGIGFFEANNFHPDFILWVLDGKLQTIAFLDPKGIYNLTGMHDAKINLSKLIKGIEKDLGDKNIRLESFIISSTKKQTLLWGDGITEQEFNRNNVYFTEDNEYLEKIMTKLGM